MTAATSRLDSILQQMAAAGVTNWDRFDVAQAANCSVEDACHMIWDHQRSQRNVRPSNRPAMRFHRIQGHRTRNARYKTGAESADLAGLAHQLGSDFLRRYEIATGLDVEAISDSNPAAAAAFSNQLQLLQMQVQVTASTLLAL